MDSRSLLLSVSRWNWQGRTSEGSRRAHQVQIISKIACVKGDSHSKGQANFGKILEEAIDSKRSSAECR